MNIVLAKYVDELLSGLLDSSHFYSPSYLRRYRAIFSKYLSSDPCLDKKMVEQSDSPEHLLRKILNISSSSMVIASLGSKTKKSIDEFHTCFEADSLYYIGAPEFFDDLDTIINNNENCCIHPLRTTQVPIQPDRQARILRINNNSFVYNRKSQSFIKKLQSPCSVEEGGRIFSRIFSSEKRKVSDKDYKSLLRPLLKEEIISVR